MEGLILLSRARAAGLAVARDGDFLVLRGPERAEAVALELLAAKPMVFTALGVEAALGTLEPWHEEGIAECRSRLLDAGALIRTFARSRWSEEADGWSVEMLAGFYVRDLLAGMAVVLGAWDGWTGMRSRLDHQTGPTAIARLWSAYASLPEAVRGEVIERGDRRQSPPTCLWRNRRG